MANNRPSQNITPPREPREQVNVNPSPPQIRPSLPRMPPPPPPKER